MLWKSISCQACILSSRLVLDGLHLCEAPRSISQLITWLSWILDSDWMIAVTTELYIWPVSLTTNLSHINPELCVFSDNKVIPQINILCPFIYLFTIKWHDVQKPSHYHKINLSAWSKTPSVHVGVWVYFNLCWPVDCTFIPYILFRVSKNSRINLHVNLRW